MLYISSIKKDCTVDIHPKYWKESTWKNNFRNIIQGHMTKATHTYCCMLLKYVAEIVLENLEKKSVLKSQLWLSQLWLEDVSFKK